MSVNIVNVGEGSGIIAFLEATPRAHTVAVRLVTIHRTEPQSWNRSPCGFDIDSGN